MLLRSRDIPVALSVAVAYVSAAVGVLEPQLLLLSLHPAVAGSLMLLTSRLLLVFSH
jgi:hypothetical protein